MSDFARELLRLTRQFDDQLRSAAAKRRRSRRVAGGRKWKDFACEALGVMPDQIDDAKQAYREHAGMNVDFTPDGRPIVTGPEQFKRMQRANNREF